MNARPGLQAACWLLTGIVVSGLASQIRPLSAQVTIQRGRVIRLAAPATAATQSTPPAAANGNAAGPSTGQPAQTDAAAPTDQKLKLLLETNYDRTTPAILKAWSYQEPPLPGEPASTWSLDARVVNAFEGFVVLEIQSGGSDESGESIESNSGLAPEQRITVQAGDREAGTFKILSVEGSRVSAQRVTGQDAKSAESGPDTPPANDEPLPANDEPPGDEGDEGAEADEGDESKPEGEGPDRSSASGQPSSTVATELQAGDIVSLTPAPSVVEKSDAVTIQREVAAFARHVTLGRWGQVKSFLAAMKPEDADKVYARVLAALATAPQNNTEEAQAAAGQAGQIPPSNFLTPDDILQLSEAAPRPIVIPQTVPPGKGDGKLTGTLQEKHSRFDIQAEPVEPASGQLPDNKGAGGPSPDGTASTGLNHLPALANLIRVSATAGHDFTEFADRLDRGTTHFGSADPQKRLTAATLLMQAGLSEHAERFLPPLEDPGTRKNLAALKIWSQLAVRKYRQKQVGEWLKRAWQINQSILGLPDADQASREAALSTLIEFSTLVDRELGRAWLLASFTDEPERGMMILANLGTRSATQALQPAQIASQQRLKLLRLQNTAVEDLLKVAPDTAKKWAPAITLLAENWLREAETTIRHSRLNGGSSFMQIDMYGNYYWVNQEELMRRGGNNARPRPIKVGDMLQVGPGPLWREQVNASLHRQLQKTFAQLHLRVNEEDKAFPFIEQLAPRHPQIARDLVHEFLRTWTRNHDPNTDRRQRNPYIYFYGFDQKAEAIPLTRSKQERNLRELQKWVERIRKLEVAGIDEKLLADAFTTCHSSAEVFHLDRVRSVFGDLENLKPETIAAICQKMRQNLTANWRDIRNQEQKQTRRREPEVQQEVLRGYSVASQLAREALESSPDNWRLHWVLACLMYDENAYSQTVQKSSEFSHRRDLAFGQFALAAQKYHDVVATLDASAQSTDVFDLWFYASLGACDLGKVTDKTVPDLRQYQKIREAIEALPGSMAEIHMAKFANNLFTRMSPVKPEIKFRYLRGGFEIVGDHPRAWEARSLYDYYRDLVSEIRLVAKIDGDDNVGHEQPFGIYVNLEHTTEIERESGGFGKYVQNQNGQMFAYNYGRPTENYRDKFSDSVRQALEEHFEILNITFQSPDTMQSRPLPRPGWRTTSYAYVLLKPQGSEIDRIAPLKLDLDFLDTSGYVVIPVESAAVVIDAAAGQGSPRPVSDLQITQTLDERQAGEGKLIVEVSATARGLVPDLEEIVDLQREDFEVVSIDDQGVLPTRFDKDSSQIQILSDRSWTVEYEARADRNGVSEFPFGEAVMGDAAVKFQRYEDADLVPADPVVMLERNYTSSRWTFLFWAIPLSLTGLAAVAGGVYFATRPGEPEVRRFNMPEDVNPFTVLTLLKDIRERNGISTEQARELQDSIRQIETSWFGKKSTAEGRSDELVAVAETWVKRAK